MDSHSNLDRYTRRAVYPRADVWSSYGFLPKDIFLIIEDYVLRLDIASLIDSGAITEETAWDDVVGYFSVRSCFAGKKSIQDFFQAIRKPVPLSLICEKIQRQPISHLPFLENWACYVLYQAIRIEIKRPELSSRDVASFPILRDLILLYPSVALKLLQQQEVSYIVDYYPRLQSIFLELLLTLPPLASDHIVLRMTQWMLNIEFSKNGLLVRLIMRLINQVLLKRQINLSALSDTFPFIPAFLLNAVSRNGRDLVKNPLDRESLNISFRGYLLSGVTDSPTIFKYLVLGADITHEILIALVQKNNKNLLHFLMNIPELNVNQTGNSGDLSDFCLFAATRASLADLIPILLDHPDIDVNQISAQSQSPLSLAIDLRDEKITQLLLEHPESNLDDLAINFHESHKFYITIYKILIRSRKFRCVPDTFLLDFLPKVPFYSRVNSLPVFVSPDLVGLSVMLVLDIVAIDPHYIGSLALKKYIYHPPIFQLLLSIPGVEGDLAIKNLIINEHFYDPFGDKIKIDLIEIAEKLIHSTCITSAKKSNMLRMLALHPPRSPDMSMLHRYLSSRLNETLRPILSGPTTLCTSFDSASTSCFSERIASPLMQFSLFQSIPLPIIEPLSVRTLRSSHLPPP